MTRISAATLALAACVGCLRGDPRGRQDSAGQAPDARTPVASVVTPHGIGPLGAGMTIAEAKAALPSLTIAGDTSHGACAYARSSELPDSVSVLIEGGRVGRVSVTGGKTRTAEGAGIGDSEQRIDSLYPGRVKVTPHKYTAGHYLTVQAADARDTVFAIVFETDSGRVRVFHAGREPQVHYVEGCA